LKNEIVCGLAVAKQNLLTDDWLLMPLDKTDQRGVCYVQSRKVAESEVQLLNQFLQAYPKNL
jgi:hypothetical protein